MTDQLPEGWLTRDILRTLQRTSAALTGAEEQTLYVMALAAHDLRAEVRAWRAAEHLRKDEPHAEFMALAKARAATDARLDLGDTP